MSLLVHPDKCQHEGAAAAFDAVKKAAEALMDAEARHSIDERKRMEASIELDRRVAAQLERERQWRVAQGTATADDARYASNPGVCLQCVARALISACISLVVALIVNNWCCFFM